MQIHVHFGPDHTTAEWVDISDHVDLKSIRRTRKYHDKLRATTNTLRFSLNGKDANLVNAFLASDSEIAVKAYSDATGVEPQVLPYFTGYIKTSYSTKARAKLEGLPLEVVDYNFQLKQKTRGSGAWQDYKVCDPSNPATSIIHSLIASLIGGDGTALIDPTFSIPSVVPWFTYGEDDTFDDLIAALLYEYGYTYYFDEDGILTGGKFVPDTLSGSHTVLDNSNMLTELQVKRKEEEKKGAVVDWEEVKTDSDVIVFQDTTGGNETLSCSIPISPSGFYPEGATLTKGVLCKFQYKGDVITVNSPELQTTPSLSSEVKILSLGNTEAELSIQAGGSGMTLTRLQVRGDCVYRQGQHQHTATIADSRSDTFVEYKAKYITGDTEADYLASVITQYYRYADYVYGIESREELSPGEIVEINENVVLGIADNTFAQVIAIQDSGRGRFTYTLEGVSEYKPEELDIAVDIINTQPPLPPGTIPAGEIPDFSSVPTWDSIAADEVPEATPGYTQVPIDIRSFTGGSGFHAIALNWDAQDGRSGEDILANLSHYEIQVSRDSGTTWYALGDADFSNQDSWKDELNVDGYTKIPVETIVHAGLPLDGTIEAPTPTSYTYRVRRCTKAGERSDWTVATAQVTAIATPVQSGSLMAGAVKANHIETALLEASRVEIGTDGERTTAITGAEISMADEGDSDAPFLRIGGRTEGGHFLPYFTGMGFMNPGAELPDSNSGIPTVNAGLCSFDAQDFIDHRGLDNHVSLPSGSLSYPDGKWGKGFQGETLIRGDQGFHSRDTGGLATFVDLGLDTTLKVLNSTPRFFIPFSDADSFSSTSTVANITSCEVESVTFVGQSSTAWDFSLRIRMETTLSSSHWVKDYDISVGKDDTGLVSYDSQWIRDRRSSDPEEFTISSEGAHYAVTGKEEYDYTSFYTFYLGLDTSGEDPVPTIENSPMTDSNPQFDLMDYDEVIRFVFIYDNTGGYSYNLTGSHIEKWLQLNNYGDMVTSGGTVYINDVDTLMSSSAIDYVKVFNDGTDIRWQLFDGGSEVHDETISLTNREIITDPSYDEITYTSPIGYGSKSFGFYLDTDGYIDDCLSYDESSTGISDAIDDHALGLEPWTPFYNDGDIILAPKTGGSVRILGTLNYQDSGAIVTVVGPEGPEGPIGPEGPQGGTHVDGGTWDTVYLVSQIIDGAGW